MLERLSSKTTNEAFPELDSLIYWVVEREAMRRRREAGEEPPFSTDEILGKYRFCNVNVQDDRVSRAIFDAFTKPYADHPGLLVALTVCRFTNEPEVIEAVRDCLVPFDAERFMVIMADRAARRLPLERRAYRIPGGVKDELKAESLTKDLFGPLAKEVESVRPKPGDTCEQVFERLRRFPYLDKGFITAQIVRDLKQVEPLHSASDWKTFVRSGPGSQRGVNRIVGAAIDRERPEAEWRSLFQKIVELAAPQVAKHGIELDAQSWQNVFCETDKFLRYRSGDLRGARRYAPEGKAPPSRARKTKSAPSPAPASIKPVETPRVQFAAVRAAAPSYDGGPHVLYRDYETRGVLDLGKVGAHRYAADQWTEVICCAYAVDDGPVQLWIPGNPVPPEFIAAATEPNWTAVAHNDQFETLIERHVMGPQHGWRLIPVERHQCTMTAALAAGLPGKLERVADYLELANRKDAAGARLMHQMSKPRKPRRGEDPEGIYYWDDPERLQRLYAYCRQDVEVERELHGLLKPLPEAEHALWLLSNTINDRGFCIDREFIAAAKAIAAAATPEITAAITELTGGAVTSINQVARLMAWLKERGYAAKSLGRRAVEKQLEKEDLSPQLRRALELRLDGAKAAVNKFNAALVFAGDDDRIRGAFRFHGARTGRFSGLGFQPQNIKRVELDDIDAAIAAVSTGDIARVQEKFEKPLSVLADVTHAMIVAAPGHEFIGADFSTVEARILAWLAGEDWKVDVFRRFDATGDFTTHPYVVAAAKALRLPAASIKKGTENYHVGKVSELSFGYQGALGAWRKFDLDRHSDEEVIAFCKSWRASHPNIVRLWYALNDAAVNAVHERGRVTHCAHNRIRFKCENDALLMRLPSGRRLTYPAPRIAEGDRGYHVVFTDNGDGRVSDFRGYGGSWTENAVSGIARDLLVAAMLRVEAAGYRITLHVHDEIATEVPIGFGSDDEFYKLMVRKPAWALDLPIAAEVWRGKRYQK